MAIFCSCTTTGAAASSANDGILGFGDTSVAKDNTSYSIHETGTFSPLGASATGSDTEAGKTGPVVVAGWSITIGPIWWGNTICPPKWLVGDQDSSTVVILP